MSFHVNGRYLRNAVAMMGAITAATSLSTLSAAYVITTLLTRPQPQASDDDYTFSPWEFDIPCENVSFASADGRHQVQAWWMPNPDAHSVIIACSGYRRDKSDMLGIGSKLWHAGHSMLLIDFFGHGSGHGSTVTLAYREEGDFLGAVEYSAQRAPEAAIGVVGFSMGGAVAIMGAARDKRVRAVVADSSFARHRDVVAVNFKRAFPITRHVPDGPILSVADHLLKWRAGYHFNEVEPVREIPYIAPRSVLLIHGTADETTPYEHSEELYAAAQEPKEIWLVRGAGHCGSYFDNRPRYCDRIIRFFAEALAPVAPTPFPLSPVSPAPQPTKDESCAGSN